MSRQNNSELKNDWYKIAHDMRALSDALSTVQVGLITAYGDMDGVENSESFALLKIINSVTDAERHLSGLGYLCTPQSEWVGGNNTKVRVPHIINDF